MSIAHSGEGDCKSSPIKAWSPWVPTSWGGAGPLPHCFRMLGWVLEGLRVWHVGVGSEAYREGSLFGPTMITITFFYMGGNTSHMCGGVVCVCGSAVAHGMWWPCGCLGGKACHVEWGFHSACTMVVLCGLNPWSTHPTQACQACHHVPLHCGVEWCLGGGFICGCIGVQSVLLYVS
jgi:hypothetical protein